MKRVFDQFLTSRLSTRIRTRQGSAFWLSSVLVAPPVAWLVASRYGLVHGDPLRDLAVLALWSIVEEAVFRGGVQATLLKKISAEVAGVTAANAITSLLFASAHLWAHPPLVALGVLPVSLVLGAAYERSGERLGPPIALHLYFNALLYAATGLRMP